MKLLDKELYYTKYALLHLDQEIKKHKNHCEELKSALDLLHK